MSRPVIPPMSSGSPCQQTIEVLAHRLQAAETDTKELLQQLSTMGFSREAATWKGEGPDNVGHKPISSFKAWLPDAEILQSNYEALVSRVCRTESAIQTMKLGLLNIQGDKDLRKKINDELEVKWGTTKHNLEGQIAKLRREVRNLQEELAQENEAKAKTKEDIKKLQSALEDATTYRAEASVTADELTTTKQKLIRHITELKEQLTMETSLRSSLEESHNTLLGRVREMESVVESERTEVQSLTISCNSLKTEVIRLKDNLAEEQSLRVHAEESCTQLISEREKLTTYLESTEGEKKLAMGELARFRGQYENLIDQLEQTRVLIEQQKGCNENLEAENVRLKSILDRTNAEQERLRSMNKQEIEVQKTRLSERIALEEEVVQLRVKARDTESENVEMKNKISKLEREISEARSQINSKDQEFSQAAGGLEKELNSLRKQLHSMQEEKQNVLADKENLLEEVNQTVDTLIEERTRIQAELDQTKIELETLYSTQREVERENAELLERLAGFEQQQVTQKKVQTVLKEMMEQKNSLAYDNGRLQSQINQLKTELESAAKGQADAMHLRKLSQGLQDKYTKAQKEISEYKVAIQRLDSQRHQLQDALAYKDQGLQLALLKREELEKELEKIMADVESIEEREKQKVHSYHKNLGDAKTVNREIANTLEAVMGSHSQLQTVVENLQVELGKRDAQISQLKNQKNKDQEEMKLEMKKFEDKMESLRGELKQEREKSLKKNSRDIAEIKKQNDNLSTRNMEVVKANTELRHRLSQSEKTIAELNQKITDQKHKMEYLHKAKKHLEENVIQLKAVRQDIDELEKMRDEYIRRNHEQTATINLFMGQITSLQEEIKQLAQAQANTSHLLKQKEEALDKEKQIRDEIKKKYNETKKREDMIAKRKREAEERLKEVHHESLEISQHLQDAHEWFKNKFEKLQTELDDSRKTQAKLEKDNTIQRRKLESEKHKAQNAAERAREMIKASRQTISKLADYADLADSETKQQIAQLKAEAQTEKDLAQFTELKHHRYKEANNRHLEHLITELDRR